MNTPNPQQGTDPGVPAAKEAQTGEAVSKAPLEIRSILVPIDFSESSNEAFQYAVAFARQFGAKLTLLHVIEVVTAGDFADTFPLLLDDEAINTGCKERLEDMVEELGVDSSLIEQILVREGRSFHEIGEAATEVRSDLIIISTHGYTGLKHVMLGGTAERVVRHAPCPVLVVREGEREFTRIEAIKAKP